MTWIGRETMQVRWWNAYSLFATPWSPPLQCDPGMLCLMYSTMPPRVGAAWTYFGAWDSSTYVPNRMYTPAILNHTCWYAA